VGRASGPAGHFDAGGPEDPRPDVADEPGFLGEWDEQVRSEPAARRMVPPDKRLGSHKLARVEIDDWLVIEDELVTGNRPSEIGFELETGLELLLHRRGEDDDLVQPALAAERQQVLAGDRAVAPIDPKIAAAHVRGLGAL